MDKSHKRKMLEEQWEQSVQDMINYHASISANLNQTIVDQQQKITEQNQTIADLKQKITEQNQKIEDQDKTLESVVQELLIKTIGKVCFACSQQGFTPGSASFTPGPHNRPASFDVFHDCHNCFSKISGLSEGRVGQPQ